MRRSSNDLLNLRFPPISFDRNAMPGMQPLPEFNKAGRQSALHRAAGDLGRRQALMSGRMEVVPESERHKPPRLPPNE
jgi:hypothetical protein